MDKETINNIAIIEKITKEHFIEFLTKNNKKIENIDDINFQKLIDKIKNHVELSLEENVYYYTFGWIMDMSGLLIRPDKCDEYIYNLASYDCYDEDKIYSFNKIFKVYKYCNFDLNYDGYSHIDEIILPEKLDGDLDLSDRENLDGIKLPKYISGFLGLHDLSTLKGIDLPEYIGDGIDLDSIKSLDNTKLPKHLSGSIYLSSLTDKNGLEFPETVSGHLLLIKLPDIHGIKLPKRVEGHLYLNNISDLDNINLPEYIGENLYLNNISDSKNINLPKFIGGDLHLNKDYSYDLSKINNVGHLSSSATALPKIIGVLDMDSSEDLSIIKSAKNINILNLYLKSNNVKLEVDNVNALNIINYNKIDIKVLDLNNVKNIRDISIKFARDINNIKLPKHISGYLDIMNLSNTKNIDLSYIESIGTLNLGILKSINRLKFPSNITYCLNLCGLTNAKNLDLYNINNINSLNLIG